MNLQNIKNKSSQKGFTIVELLIVIVVIGILAAITIVAYNGIQNRARTSSAQSLANTILKKADAYNAVHGVYPTFAELQNNYAPGTTVANSGAPEARLDNPSSIITTAPTANNGTTAVRYIVCGASPNFNGAKARYFHYVNNAQTTGTTTPPDPSTGAC